MADEDIDVDMDAFDTSSVSSADTGIDMGAVMLSCSLVGVRFLHFKVAAMCFDCGSLPSGGQEVPDLVDRDGAAPPPRSLRRHPSMHEALTP
eukprot:5634506-Alexandrium_andersonii.AAC.1